MTENPRTLTISSDLFWYERLPGWFMPEALRLMPSLRSELAQLSGKRPTKVCFSENVSFMLNWLGIDKMPRKKKDTNNENATGNKPYKSSVQWINVQLTDDDIDAITRTVYEPDQLAAQLLGLCLEGYSIGVKPTPDGAGWMAYITGAASDNPDATIGLTGYSDTPIDAVIGLLYKFHDKLDGVLNAPAQSITRKFR